jgi:hypothetical protein
MELWSRGHRQASLRNLAYSIMPHIHAKGTDRGKDGQSLA